MLFTVVRQASWSSLYDVRADLTSHPASGEDSSRPTIALQYRAKITQNTGEDWEGVVLTLSTASPLLASDIPVLQPWKIGQLRPAPAAPPPPRLAVIRTNARTRSRRGGVSSAAEGAFEEDTVYAGDSGPKIAISEGAISSTFEIDGLSTIPSDNTSHKVSIAVRSSFSWISLRMIPGADDLHLVWVYRPST